MPYALAVQLKVEDYAKWKSAFDEFAAARKAAGQKSYQLFRSLDDPNTLVLLAEYDSLDNMRKFSQSDELREAMQQSGVTDPGMAYELEELERGTL